MEALLLVISAILDSTAQDKPTPLAVQSVQRPDPRHRVHAYPVYSVPAGVVLWIHHRDGSLNLDGLEPWQRPLRLRRYTEPDGDGIWIELLSVRLERVGAFRGAVPTDDGICGLQVPVVRGLWWLMVSDRRGGSTQVLGLWEIGPLLLKLVETHDLPVL